MKEIICPDCRYKNPNIRELGYKLPWACNNCSHIWRLQDLDLNEKPKTKEEALRMLMSMGMITKNGKLTKRYSNN